jgi:hypothetical protein
LDILGIDCVPDEMTIESSDSAETKGTSKEQDNLRKKFSFAAAKLQPAKLQLLPQPKQAKNSTPIFNKTLKEDGKLPCPLPLCSFIAESKLHVKCDKALAKIRLRRNNLKILSTHYFKVHADLHKDGTEGRPFADLYKVTEDGLESYACPKCDYIKIRRIPEGESKDDKSVLKRHRRDRGWRHDAYNRIICHYGQHILKLIKELKNDDDQEEEVQIVKDFSAIQDKAIPSPVEDLDTRRKSNPSALHCPKCSFYLSTSVTTEEKNKTAQKKQLLLREDPHDKFPQLVRHFTKTHTLEIMRLGIKNKGTEINYDNFNCYFCPYSCERAKTNRLNCLTEHYLTQHEEEIEKLELPESGPAKNVPKGTIASTKPKEKSTVPSSTTTFVHRNETIQSKGTAAIKSPRTYNKRGKATPQEPNPETHVFRYDCPEPSCAFSVTSKTRNEVNTSRRRDANTLYSRKRCALIRIVTHHLSQHMKVALRVEATIDNGVEEKISLGCGMYECPQPECDFKSRIEEDKSFSSTRPNILRKLKANAYGCLVRHYYSHMKEVVIPVMEPVSLPDGSSEDVEFIWEQQQRQQDSNSSSSNFSWRVLPEAVEIDGQEEGEHNGYFFDFEDVEGITTHEYETTEDSEQDDTFLQTEEEDGGLQDALYIEMKCPVFKCPFTARPSSIYTTTNNTESLGNAGVRRGILLCLSSHHFKAHAFPQPKWGIESCSEVIGGIEMFKCPQCDFTSIVDDSSSSPNTAGDDEGLDVMLQVQSKMNAYRKMICHYSGHLKHLLKMGDGGGTVVRNNALLSQPPSTTVFQSTEEIELLVKFEEEEESIDWGDWGDGSVDGVESYDFVGVSR